MKRNKFFSRFITVTLTVALLLSMGSRAIRVSALADPVEALSPIYDTTIYQLQDYIDNGGLTSDQLDIFYILSGALLVAQAGSSEYELNDPYTTRDGVEGWLKSCGLQLYNAIVNMNIIGVDPNTGIDQRKIAKPLVDYLFGVSQKALDYESLADFNNDIANRDDFYIPLNADIMYSLNQTFALKGGLYMWQLREEAFTTSRTYVSNPDLISVIGDFIRAESKSSGSYAYRYPAYSRDIPFFSTYKNIFINITNYKAYLVDDFGNEAQYINLRQAPYNTYKFGYTYSYSNNFESRPPYEPSYAYKLAPQSPNVPAGVRYNAHDLFTWLGDSASFWSWSGSTTSQFLEYGFPFVADFVQHVYKGYSWDTREEIFNTTDLSFTMNDLGYYQSVQTDTLFDIKGLIEDLINTTVLKPTFIDNLLDPSGLFRVSVELILPDDYYTPPLPVNLNDIAEYTDNTYLDIVKERATAAGSTLAELVAFWHNCDAEIVYVLFGCAIMTLVGAFIGKWGHS